MNSYASFTTPVSVGYMSGDMSLDTRTIYLGGSEVEPMFAYIPPPLRKAINNAKKKSMLDSALSFSIRINLKNDTSEDVKISPVVFFINDTPILSMGGYGFPLRKGYKAQIRLSDVSVASLFSEELEGTTAILLPVTK